MEYINKYIIMKKICITILATILVTACANQGERKATNLELPNVLFIMSDDHTSQAISAYGGALGSVCPTPNIDR